MCRPLQENCVDWEWLCPGWEKCGNPFDDCTASKCCRSGEAADDGNDYACFRRPISYYAQCRIAHTSCLTWEQYHKKEAVGLHDPDMESFGAQGWICPGWEQCSGAFEEVRRCCSTVPLPSSSSATARLCACSQPQARSHVQSC